MRKFFRRHYHTIGMIVLAIIFLVQCGVAGYFMFTDIPDANNGTRR